WSSDVCSSDLVQRPGLVGYHSPFFNDLTAYDHARAPRGQFFNLYFILIAFATDGGELNIFCVFVRFFFVFEVDIVEPACFDHQYPGVVIVVLEPAPSLGDNTPETRVTRCYMVVVSTLDFFEFFETQTVFFGSGGQRHVVRLAKEGSVGITVVCGIRVYEETHGIYPHSARFASGNIHTVDHRGGDVDVHETLDTLVFPPLGIT